MRTSIIIAAAICATLVCAYGIKRKADEWRIALEKGKEVLKDAQKDEQ